MGLVITMLLTLLFLAACVGLIKPFIKGTKRWQFGLAAVVVAIVGMQSIGADLNNEFATQAALANGAGTENSEKGASSNPSPEGGWVYDEEKDEMRNGATSRYAELAAEDVVDLDFPYGQQRGQILIRQSAKFGFDILVGVPSGQIICRSYRDGHINVKFDDGEIRRFGCSEASDGTSNMVFVDGANGFLKQLKKANKVIIEAEFYRNGMQQMTFRTSGLKWD